MRFLRKMVDAGRKLYHEPGSRLHKFWPLFDAGEINEGQPPKELAILQTIEGEESRMVPAVPSGGGWRPLPHHATRFSLDVGALRTEAHWFLRRVLACWYGSEERSPG